MSEFEKWHDTYESDTRELLIYNAMDLKAAWDAAMLHAAEKQQSQLRLLADAVLENHTNCCDACPEGDIHACSGFAITGMVNCCQCEACKIAREVRGGSGA